MAIPFDLDMVAFFWVNLRVILGTRRRARESTRRVPMHLEYVEVRAEQLTEAQKAYMKPIDEQLEALNYRPVCTFRATNYGRNLLRRYSNPVDPASCALTIVEVKGKSGDTESVRNSSVVEFATRFPDERKLITRNMQRKSLFDTPPERIIQDCPNVSDLAELKGRHDARAQKLGIPVAPKQDAASIFKELQADHERFSNFLVERGIYKIAPEGGAYALSEKVHFRGLINHYLPFGRRLSLVKILFSILVGAAFPLLGILKLGPMLASSYSFPFLGFSGAKLVIMGCYALAGALIGYVCEGQKFSWVYIVTYVPAHLVAGWSFGTYPYSGIAFAANFAVGQMRRRQKLILQPES